MNRDVRAALIGGLAATFVVAASLAPKLMTHPSEVTVHTASADEGLVVGTTTSPDPTSTSTSTATSTTTTTATAIVQPPSTTTAPPVTATTTTAPVRPEVTFYYEGTTGLGPGAETAPDDGTWKVGFRTTQTAPGLRVRYLARTKAGSAEFTAEFSDPRPMYNFTAIGHIDSGLLDLPANPPAQTGTPVFFEKIVAVEWDGGSQTF